MGGVREVTESEQSSIIVALAATSRFLTCCSVLRPQSVKDNWCRKSSRNFALFDPLQNLWEEWADCLSELIKFNLWLNLWYTFAGSLLCEFGQGLSNGWKNNKERKERQTYKVHSDYRRTPLKRTEIKYKVHPDCRRTALINNCAKYLVQKLNHKQG